MSLRLKLLLLGLATLILPWGGCQYAREMESALREGEQSSLQAVSQTIAASLQGRTDLLYREALAPATFGDRVWLGFEDSGGEQHQVFLAATGPGSVTARRIETGEYGQQNAPIEPRIHGAWQLTGHGYRIELRVPMSMLGNGFGV